MRIQLRQLNLAVKLQAFMTIGLRTSWLQYPVETFTSPYKSRHKDATAWMTPHLVPLMIAHSRTPVNPSSGHNSPDGLMDRITQAAFPRRAHGQNAHYASTLVGIAHPCYTTIEGILP